MYSVSQISEMIELPTSTLRFYEKKGIIPNINRDASGRRQYTDDDLLLLNLVICLKDTGMTMEDIKKYTNLIIEGTATLEQRRELLLAHKEIVEKQMIQTMTYLKQLEQKIELYNNLIKDKKISINFPKNSFRTLDLNQGLSYIL